MLPHLVTACAAIALSLMLQGAFTPAPAPLVATSTAAPTPRPPTPAPTPAPTDLPLEASISRQEVADLRAEISRLWVALYLNRAVSYVADAETALRMNDRQAISQALLKADDSLALAHASAEDWLKNPIEEFRREMSRLRDDLYLRPEGLDARFATLRQGILTLVEARE